MDRRLSFGKAASFLLPGARLNTAEALVLTQRYTNLIADPGVEFSTDEARDGLILFQTLEAHWMPPRLLVTFAEQLLESHTLPAADEARARTSIQRMRGALASFDALKGRFQAALELRDLLHELEL